MRRHIRDIAVQRIARLLTLADLVYGLNKELSRRYVLLATRIARRARVRIPDPWRLRICKRCLTILKPGVNCSIRIRPKRGKHIVIRCLECGHIIRVPIERRLRASRRATLKASGTP